MNRFLPDTNCAIQFLIGERTEVERWANSDAVFLCPPVYGELLFGARNSRRVAENLKRLESLVSRCELLAITTITADFYSSIKLQLRTIGRPIPENDIWIAAVALENDLPVATSDAHFNYVVGLKLLGSL